ncbi:MAG: amidohydrolase family protein [Luteitalea sp.]|nr:amidohydrolase family protein [Luteitalea sp.]
MRCFLLILTLALAIPACSRESYDLLIVNGTVVDGTGAEGRREDVGIRDGRIVALGDLSSAQSARTIDATGLVVAPGFVDMHNHSDDTLLDEPRCESMIRQGVTTMVLGEGESQGPLREGERAWTTLGGYFDHVAHKGVAANIGSYVGQGQVWTYVKGHEMTPATPDEIEAMQEEIARAMREGAMGLSTSLLMPPANLVTNEQLADLARVAGEYGGIYSTHIRDEGEGVLDAVQEAINVGTWADIRVDIIHMKIAHRELWGRVSEIFTMIEQARADGHDIRANVYPYRAGNNNLRSIIPPWAHDGGNEKMLERLRDPRLRARMRREILEGLPGWYNHYLATGGGWGGMQLVALADERNAPFVGKRMSELIAARGGDPVEVLFDVLLEEEGSVSTIFFHHAEEDMQQVMKQPYTSIGSDGSAISRDGRRASTHVHPRWYGTFPRVLARYTRELKLLTLPEAVRKMTTMNAEKINVVDRGVLKTGNWADVTVFDPDTVADKATFEEPHQYPEGIPYVIVNGVLVLDNGKHTGALPGQVLTGPGYRRNPQQTD